MSSPAKKQPDPPAPAAVIDNAEIFAKVSLFTEIKDNREAFSVLYMLMSVRQYNAGEIIIKEGEAGSDFFILADGNADVFKTTQDGDQYKVAILGGHMGAFFGEGGLLDADTRTATITAATQCRCMVLTKADFDQFCAQYPQWAMPIIRRVAQAVMNRLRNMNQDLGLLYKALVDEFAQR